MRCTDTLPGLFAGIVLRCELDEGHHGRHFDTQVGFRVDWTDNTYLTLEDAA